MISLETSNALFEIHDVRKVSLEEIQKKYRKLCLKYHPDKGLETTSDKFIQIQQANDRVVQEKRRLDEQGDADDAHDAAQEDSIYGTLFALLRVDNLEKIVDWVLDYQQARRGETVLHVTFDQVLRKEVFPHCGVYIPLWHRKISHDKLVDKEDGKKDIYVIKIHDIPSYVQLLDNNDLLVYVNKEVLKSDKKEVYLCITENKWVSFALNEVTPQQGYHVLWGQGIPQIQEDDAYDVSIMTNVILCFTNQTNHSPTRP